MRGTRRALRAYRLRTLRIPRSATLEPICQVLLRSVLSGADYSGFRLLGRLGSRRIESGRDLVSKMATTPADLHAPNRKRHSQTPLACPNEGSRDRLLGVKGGPIDT